MFLFNEEQVFPIEISSSFKYILCFYSILLEFKVMEDIKTFKYILCFYSIFLGGLEAHI